MTLVDWVGVVAGAGFVVAGARLPTRWPLSRWWVAAHVGNFAAVAGTTVLDVRWAPWALSVGGLAGVVVYWRRMQRARHEASVRLLREWDLRFADLMNRDDADGDPVG